MRGNTGRIPLDHNVHDITVRESFVHELVIHQQSPGKEKKERERARFYVLSRKQYAAKRVLDLGIGFFGLLAFVLLYPFVALGIKLSSRGPVLFKQQRTGRNGHSFTCYKFRTMHLVQRKTKGNEPDITRVGDCRIFAFGKLLRKLNLDELPQIINVFKGNMSLVGPRPYPVKECAYWNSTFNDFFYRYTIQPGITGLAQARGYRGGTLNEEHMRKRLDYDLIYVKKCSMLLDLKIIGKTLMQMIHLKTNGH